MKPLPWSPSALETFKNCPEQYHHRYVLKDLPPQEQSVEQVYGERVHEAFADRQRPKHKKLPADLAIHEPFMQKLAAQPGQAYVEHKAALAKNLETCEWGDKNIWCRMIIDYLRVDAKESPCVDRGLQDWQAAQEVQPADYLCVVGVPGVRLFRRAHCHVLLDQGSYHDRENMEPRRRPETVERTGGRPASVQRGVSFQRLAAAPVRTLQWMVPGDRLQILETEAMRKPKSKDESEEWVKKQVKLILKDTGWNFWMPNANAFGRSGVSDFLAIKNDPSYSWRSRPSTKTCRPRCSLSFSADVYEAGHFAFLVDETNIETLRRRAYGR